MKTDVSSLHRSIAPSLHAPLIPACARCRVSSVEPGTRSTAVSPFRFSGFTLIELLVVISIIGILAAMLLPVLSKVKEQGKKGKAKIEIGQIAAAIHDYESANNRFPASAAALNAAAAVTAANGGPQDFTFGTDYTAGGFKTPGGGPYAIEAKDAGGNLLSYQTNNAEIIAILMDNDNGVNAGHVKNPQRTKYLNATLTGDTTSPGVGSDGVYRDPWGQPYIITVDLNSDDKARDSFYRLKAVSQDPAGGQNGLNGLFNSIDANKDLWEFSGPVMVWSAGPDKMIDPGAKANQGANKDNILSWKP